MSDVYVNGNKKQKELNTINTGEINENIKCHPTNQFVLILDWFQLILVLVLL